MTRRHFLLLALCAAAAYAPRAKADTVADFYKGRTVTVVVSSSAAGGYDTLARALARHMLARLAGNVEPPSLRRAKLTHKVSSTVGLAELVPVRCDGASATPIASGYVPLSALAQANGWVLIRPDSEGYPEASEVMIRPWP